MQYLHPELLIILGIAGVPVVLLLRYHTVRHMDQGFILILVGSILLTLATAVDYADTYLFRDFFYTTFHVPTYRAFLALFGYLPGILLMVIGIARWFILTVRLEDEVARRVKAEQALVHKTELLAKAATDAEMADRAKSDFLANMSHELRTPLNAIIGFSEMMQAKVSGSLSVEQIEEYSALIHRSGKGLLDIVNDMLDLSRIQAEKFEMQETKFMLGDVTREGLEMLAHAAEKKEISLVATIADDVCMYGDERLVRQMVFNLVSNAVKFTDSGGSVTVANFVMPDDACAIIVKDTGCGMSEEEVARVIKPFNQLQGAMIRSHEGAGLGLTLVKTFTELHGGTMLVESQKHQGTSVCLTFPVERSVALELQKTG